MQLIGGEGSPPASLPLDGEPSFRISLVKRAGEFGFLLCASYVPPNF